MHTIGQKILADILANPADDGLRLIYSDWLEEHGDADAVIRAEFIRVQVELATLPDRLTVEVYSTQRLGESHLTLGVYELMSRADSDPPQRGDLLDVHEPASMVRWGALTVLDVQDLTDVPPGWGPFCRRLLVRPAADPHYARRAELLAREEGLSGDEVPVRRPDGTRGEIAENLYRWAQAELSWAQGVCFRRGFVERVVCRGDAWVRNGDACLKRHPVRDVQLLAPPPPIATQAPIGGGFNRCQLVGATRPVILDRKWPQRAGGLELLRAGWPGVQFGPASPPYQLEAGFDTIPGQQAIDAAIAEASAAIEAHLSGPGADAS